MLYVMIGVGLASALGRDHWLDTEKYHKEVQLGDACFIVASAAVNGAVWPLTIARRLWNGDWL